jgi:hypothetical protein
VTQIAPRKATKGANSIHCTGGEKKGGTASKKLLKQPNIFPVFSRSLLSPLFFSFCSRHLSCPIAWSVGAFVQAAMSLGLSFANLTPEKGHMLQ